MRARQISFFLTRRILALIVLLLLISFLVFGLLYLAPGNAIQVLLGTHPSSPAIVAALKAKYHLNDPFLVQYLKWLGGVLRGERIETAKGGKEVHAADVARAVELLLNADAWMNAKKWRPGAAGLQEYQRIVASLARVGEPSHCRILQDVHK